MQSTADRRNEKLSRHRTNRIDHFTVVLSCFDSDELCHSLVEDGCLFPTPPVEEKTEGVKLPFSLVPHMIFLTFMVPVGCC